MADKETSRLEAFSDGVFGIAMTLLIIDIRLPPMSDQATNRELLRALGGLWPSYLSFFISFVTVLIMWINHHGLFRLVHAFNRRFLFANGFVLLMVTVVNFPTKVLAEHLGQAGANVAVALYCGTYVLVAVSFNLMLWTALPNLRPDVRQGPHSPVRRIRAAYRMGALVYAVATVVGYFIPYLGLSLCMALWVLWTLLNYRPGRRATVAGADEPERGEPMT
jgi:uncharacterized membrane protein